MISGLPLLYALLPTLVAWALLEKAGVVESGLLRWAMAWFLGQLFATMAVFAVATTLKPFTRSVLARAALLVLIGAAAALVVVRKWFAASLRRAHRPLSGRAAAGTLILLAACVAFSWGLFAHHLAQTPTEIWRSGVYWDFNIHYPSIQNFVFGDNFPPQNESFSGAPLTYHFFFDLLIAVSVALGWNLATAITVVSVVAFVALLALVVGFAREFTGSTAVGVVAAALTLTSSSLRFLDFVVSSGARSAFELWQSTWENPAHPYLFSFLGWTPDHYDGAMFNVFYFVAERQLIFAAGLLLTALAVLPKRRRWTPAVCALVGIGMGLFIFWHVFVTLSVGAALLLLLALAPERRRTALILGGYAAVVGVAVLVAHGILARPDWFSPEALAGPRWNPGFTTRPGGPPPSLRQAVGYYAYAYGLKLALFPLGLLVAWRRRRDLFFLLCAAVFPSFLLVNTVQLRPLSVYDNHKWLRPMNVLVDVGVALYLVSLPARYRLRGTVAATALFALSTLSGVIELVPFLRARPIYRYAGYPTAFTRAVSAETPPEATFVSSQVRALHLAGRKLFLGSKAGPLDAPPLVVIARYNTSRRERIVAELYGAPNAAGLCRLTSANGIDFVEVPDPPAGNSVLAEVSHRGSFATTTEEGRPIRFLDVRRACGGQRGAPGGSAVDEPAKN